MNSLTSPRRPHVSPLPDGLRAESFAPTLDAEGAADARSAAHLRTTMHGFYGPWLTDEEVSRHTETFIADAQRQVGVYLDAESEEPGADARRRVGFSADHPVATFVEFDETLDAGGRGAEGPLLDARLITGVTVDPGFRRRGILSHLMTSSLARAVEDGVPLAALTASEGGIYGRFGFGAAVREAELRVDLAHTAGTRLQLRGEPSGQVISADPTAMGEVVDEVWAQFHRRVRGSVDRPLNYLRRATARWSPRDVTSWDRRLRAAVHVRDDGSVGGYVTFRHAGWETEPSTLEIADLVAADATSHVELWRHLSQRDLVARAELDGASVEDVLTAAAVNPRSVQVREVRDVLWVRLLDVVRCLQAREWGGDGVFTLWLSDPLGIADGVYRVEVSAGVAAVEPVTEQEAGQETAGPVLSTDVETLGSLYLGDAAVVTMQRAGRLSVADGAAASGGAGDAEGALRELSAIVDLPTRPFCATHF
ncbi:GNAT family N-acetyltransferase [Nesterenkonia sp. F]|uniref:GNAT family N-acetyltransferase n=1 Tax=Nesterenkonia sp. F TaxID=795955 RepID=UPI000255D28F|nr:GNAT family N-acetyltransferase [Nesterenkonia sp. F]